MPRKPVIAIDGPAASGKSTTAKLVAKRLGYLFIDTGAMYRALGLKARRLGITFDRVDDIARMAENTGITQQQAPDGAVTFLDGEDVSQAIRSPEISQAASDISTIPAVRRRLVKLQQQMGAGGGVVMEGRDITTVVFPDAEVKVFMQASIAERAKRRQAELASKGTRVDLAELEKQIELRDQQDSQRADSPLTCTPDSLIIDTTGLSIEQQVEMVLARAAMVRKGGS